MIRRESASRKTAVDRANLPHDRSWMSPHRQIFANDHSHSVRAIEQVLKVVENQQPALVAEKLKQCLFRVVTAQGQADSRSDSWHNLGGCGERGESDKKDTVGESAPW